MYLKVKIASHCRLCVANQCIERVETHCFQYKIYYLMQNNLELELNAYSKKLHFFH